MNEQQYDKKLNIQTEGYQMGFPKSIEYHRYEPTPYKALEELFEQYELLPNACCLDIGCGKGRVPIYIHDRFHIRTKGIEMDPKFFAAAEQNLAQYRQKGKRKTNDILLIHDIAENYSIVEEDNTFFFFNPFSINIFRKLMKNIMTSFEEHPRTIHFIFYYPSPEYVDALTDEFMLEHVIEVPLRNEKNKNERILVYALNG